MEEIKVAAAETLDTKSGITAEIVNSEIAGENPLDSVSIGSPLVKEGDSVKPNTGEGELCPLTPSPTGEIVEMLSVSDQTDGVEALSDCETPTECLFNPFAPGPEIFALAPAPKKKMPREYKLPTRRQLNFDSDSDSEEKLKEICSKDLAEEDNSSDDASDGYKTPTSIPLLTGIAETCPDAPKRPSFKSRKLDLTISRKLEFESSWI